jgi:DNA-binding MarR family transcriptional regulator
MTGAELATQVSLSPSTIKEHLDQLEKAHLIEQMDEGRKWKYYALTFKGRQITTSERPSMRVWIVLGLSMLGLVFATLNIFFLGGTFAPQNELLATGAADTFATKSAYGGSGAADDATAFNNPVPAVLDSCDATPNSCLSGQQALTAGVQEAAPMATRSMHSVSNDLPTPQQVSTIDLAIESALLVLVLGLGYYAIRQKKRAAI